MSYIDPKPTWWKTQQARSSLLYSAPDDWHYVAELY